MRTSSWATVLSRRCASTAIRPSVQPSAVLASSPAPPSVVLVTRPVRRVGPCTASGQQGACRSLCLAFGFGPAPGRALSSRGTNSWHPRHAGLHRKVTPGTVRTAAARVDACSEPVQVPTDDHAQPARPRVRPQPSNRRPPEPEEGWLDRLVEWLMPQERVRLRGASDVADPAKFPVMSSTGTSGLLLACSLFLWCFSSHVLG